MKKLTFDKFRKANLKRCEKHFHKLEEWSLTDWGCAVAGEVGEACNICKKIKRGDFPTSPELIMAQQLLGKEIADAVTYLDLLAARAGLSLDEILIQKFN